MRKHMSLFAVTAVGVLSVGLSLPGRPAHAQQVVFQAAGPTAASIQGTVDAFRAALGEPNNGNGPAASHGRREINWDGAVGLDTTTAPVTPFDVFLITRGALFTTPGTGLSQAPPSGGPAGRPGRALQQSDLRRRFRRVQPLATVDPGRQQHHRGMFFVPGRWNGAGDGDWFGAVFTDVDQPDGAGRPDAEPYSTLIEYFDADGKLMSTRFVPASPGQRPSPSSASCSTTPLIARVRITTGDAAPGRTMR